jgi:ribonuclease HI
MPITAYTDGANRVSKPGMASCAWMINLPGGHRVSQGYFLGPEPHTNNYAEYHGLLYLLRHLYDKMYTGVLIHCDSKLVVEQVNRRWEIKHQELAPYAHEAYGLLMQGYHKLIHVRGHGGNENATDNEGNDYVDKLCNQVLDQQGENERAILNVKK